MRVNLKNSSLASQAVDPPLSAFETVAEKLPIAPLRVTLSETTGQVTVVEATPQEVANNSSIDSLSADSSSTTAKKAPTETKQLTPLKRIGRKLGKKLTVLRLLGKQLVAKDDSVLGSYSRGSQPGLNVEKYSSLIEKAFKPEWWQSNMIVQVDPKTGSRTILRKPAGSLSTIQYTLMEYNFSLFFGLAVQAYESTLVSDNSPFDQYFDGNSSAISDRQKRGLEVFQNQG